MNNLEQLRNQYNHFEWLYDIKLEKFYINAINIYGKWAYFSFFKEECIKKFDYIERQFGYLEQFRIYGYIPPSTYLIEGRFNV